MEAINRLTTNKDTAEIRGFSKSCWFVVAQFIALCVSPVYNILQHSRFVWVYFNQTRYFTVYFAFLLRLIVFGRKHNVRKIYHETAQ